LLRTTCKGENVNTIFFPELSEIEAVLKSIPSYKKGNTLLPFCFVDPFSLDLSFSTIAKLGKNLMDFLILQLHMDATGIFENI
jgi:hypothetical protein